APGEFEAVNNALEAAGLKPEIAEVTMRPENSIELAGDDAARTQKIIDMLDDMADVEAAYPNAKIGEGRSSSRAAAAASTRWPGSGPSRPRCRRSTSRPATAGRRSIRAWRTLRSPTCARCANGRSRRRSP